MAGRWRVLGAEVQRLAAAEVPRCAPRLLELAGSWPRSGNRHQIRTCTTYERTAQTTQDGAQVLQRNLDGINARQLCALAVVRGEEHLDFRVVHGVARVHVRAQVLRAFRILAQA